MSAAPVTAKPTNAHAVHTPALADDTPSRHPCKIRIPSAQKRYMFDPYKAQVTLGLEGADEELDSDQAESVDDCAFDNVVSDEENAMECIDPPMPVDDDHIPNHSHPFSGSSSSDLDNSTNNYPHPFQQTMLHGLRSTTSSSPTPAPSLSRPQQQDERSSTANAAGAHYTSDDGCYRMISGNVHHVLVRFKFSDDIYVVPPCDRHGLAVGDLVVVSGDRGENIGQVAADVSDMYRESETSQKPILRRALNKDRKKYYHARRKDALASKAAQQISQEHNLPMHVLDAEFQSDLGKLTIYYRALSSDTIDFKELQRGLYKQFRCRIWLVNWDEDKGLQLAVQKQLKLSSNTSTQNAGARAPLSLSLSGFMPTGVPTATAVHAPPITVSAVMAAPTFDVGAFGQNPVLRASAQTPALPAHRVQPQIVRRGQGGDAVTQSCAAQRPLMPHPLPLGAAAFAGMLRIPAVADRTAPPRVMPCY